jgi:DNA-binding NtrC family response regulator
MSKKVSLEGKKILIVDDEPDVLDTLEEELDTSMVSKASSFEEAKRLLESQDFDIAILDIMGVNGYALLEIAKKKNLIPVMLSSHALTTENIVKSRREGASYFLPKSEMAGIREHLLDLLEAKAEGKDYWWRWYERMASYCENQFGPDWEKKEYKFWEQLKKL